jgi:hypothetical protein
MNVCCAFVCCQVEVSATSWSLVQRSTTDCGASCVWSRNLVNEEAIARVGPQRHEKQTTSLFQQSLPVSTNIFYVFYSKVKLINILYIARSDFECLNIVSSWTISSVDPVLFLEALAAAFCHYQKLVLCSLSSLLSISYFVPACRETATPKWAFHPLEVESRPSPLFLIYSPVFLPLLYTPILTLKQLSALLSEVRDTNNISEHNPLI